ncbi:MAG: hypothetical protein V3V05_09775, partial [Pontiella sp.]
MGYKVKDGMVNDYQLALVSKSIFDIGPRTRFLLLLFGMIGVALAFMESLVSGKQVPLDKIIHFSGYFTLSVTFVLALRPVLFIPGLFGLVAMGVVIEFLQRMRLFGVRLDRITRRRIRGSFSSAQASSRRPLPVSLLATLR